MRITTFTAGQSFVQLALVSLALLPKLILTQQASDARVYASTVILSKKIYVISGSNSTLDVPVLNFENGLDVNSITWLHQGQDKPNPALKPFDRGVVFQGAKDNVYIQGGKNASKEFQELVRYYPEGNEYENSVFQAEHNARPAASWQMTATINPETNIAYYYGGQFLDSPGASASNAFTSFDTNTLTWASLSPHYPNASRPGRFAHTSNIINNQVFIFGGLTDKSLNSNRTQADFASVLVYDINSNTAATVATLGDIPPMKQAYSTALGIDGRSIVMYGGYIFDYPDTTGVFKPASDDVYVLDTCTLTWRKQSVGGTSPGALYGHNAVNINNYMVLLMGKSDEVKYNERVYILDMSRWKWVSSFGAEETSSTIASSSCQFQLPSINSTNFHPLYYDHSVLENPLDTASKKKAKSTGFGVGFGMFALVLIAGGAWFYMRRRRNKSRSLNPRWMRNVPSHTNGSAYGDDRDYPLFVYNKELDKDNTNNPNYNRQNAFAPHGVRTYTASDHEQWEQQLNEEAENPRNGQSMDRHSDIWKRMRGLNDASVISDEEVRAQTRQNDDSTTHSRF